ncbi:MAG: methyltransferase domain-containing protein, partial [Candidatus Nanoarchaeia archaeon]
WEIRNSVESVDYDSRAYDSIIPIQRYWQRKRYSIIMEGIDRNKKILDMGCGTNKIIQELPEAVASDIDFRRINYLKKTNRYRIVSDVNYIPFKNEIFDTVICSQVIEHIHRNENIFREFNRVLKKEGMLILGTPDYDKVTWRMIEYLYKKLLTNAYGDQHITKYTKNELVNMLMKHGFQIISQDYVMNSELVIKAKKNET